MLKEIVDAAVIYGVVAVNAVIGFIQEFRARRAIEALARSISKEATGVEWESLEELLKRGPGAS